MQVHGLPIEEVDIDGKDPGDNIPHGGDDEGEMGTMAIRYGAHHGWKHHAARDGRNEQGTAHLRVAAQSTQGQREDRCEAGGFEGEDDHEKRDGDIAYRVHGRDGEDEARPQEEYEDESRLDHGGHHGEPGRETHAGVDALGRGEKFGSIGLFLAGLDTELDKVVGNCYLSANVAELGEGAEEEVLSGGGSVSSHVDGKLDIRHGIK
jgi:hypothetical protein